MVRKRMVAATALIGVMVLLGGFVSYQLGASKANGKLGEGIPIGGYVVIKAYHADGQLFATWQGHNTLEPGGVNAIAACMSGASGSPIGWGTCSNMTPDVYAADSTTQSIAFQPAAATNTILPVGCDYSSYSGLNCTGWQATGTVVFSASAPPEGGSFPFTVNAAGAMNSLPVPNQLFFDSVTVSPSIVVNAGDSLVITVTFSIT